LWNKVKYVGIDGPHTHVHHTKLKCMREVRQDKVLPYHILVKKFSNVSAI